MQGKVFLFYRKVEEVPELQIFLAGIGLLSLQPRCHHPVSFCGHTLWLCPFPTQSSPVLSPVEPIKKMPPTHREMLQSTHWHGQMEDHLE